MANLFLALFLLSLLGFVVGLIKPSLFNKGFKNGANRKKTSLTFIICIVVFFILFGITSPHKNNPVIQSNTAAQTPPAEATTTAANSTLAPTTSTPPAANKPITTPTPNKPVPTQVAPVVTPTPTTEVLFSASGSGTKTTQTFTTPSDNWQLDWTYDCSNFGDQGNFQVYIFNSDGSMSYDNAGVNQLGKSGADTEYYHKGGTFYLEVNSECKWTVKAKG